MTRTLNKYATAVSFLLAMIITLGLIAASSADARPIYMKYEDIEGQAQAKPAIASGYTGPTVCCYLPRKNLLGILTPAQCKKLKGQAVSRKKCDNAGARSSDAYFVKVDRETAGQN